jgi:hypothetical protein
MVHELKVVGEHTAELQLDHACPVCSGPIQLRLSPEGARGVCVTCQVISTAVVRRDHAGLSVNFPTVGQA